ncbi:MAG: bifunctional (p)ppGpp synthetase/guanosine-3',5'-bis(diphosphate) 3'-pyrophosphohydrolase [Bacteroidales bacterium]|nr:bifunctional (p)ppGpp synthetase/guanosine-3',5'-bis(diphosphate) 3'-pyrophosphohydrolase [Bacteroidales bacterium]MBP5373666.1 bifunctional (p)ppGpp synthetase/guanosine-3',5'-bis(diphosphate) 3'-pyrophosphohydrolase [Bacteroidales bacterium]
MSFSEFTEKDYQMIEQQWQLLRASAEKRCASQSELDVVRRAYEFANAAHRNVRRRSGQPYMLHPLAVAQIVVDDIGLGYKSISAALLHDVVEDTEYTVQDLRQEFGDKIATLVDGLTKIKTVLDTEQKNLADGSQQSLQAENFKRILLTLNDDVRVVLIKLADRLHNCRTIEHMPEHKRDKILSETMFIFIPLAHRLGLYSIKSELENIWLRYKEPEAYEDITARINRNVQDRKQEITDFVAPIEDALTKAGFRFEIKKRVKTPYSVWRKMQTKQVPFDEVYDLYAVRIIFDANPASADTERDQCYHIFSIITGLYRYMPERLRDWVKYPKSNGYEALHCTLLSPSGIWVEVQIRTRRMDDIAEKGIAAHWAYKKEGYLGEGDNEMESWLSRIQAILVNPDVNALELLDIIHNDLTNAEIYVYTPKGDQRSIQKDATALDFAYLIHTEIGHKAIAAKVNQRLVKLSHVLKTGDKVEIITAEDARPQHEWMQFLVTHRARSLVLDYFKNERRQTVEFGRKTLIQKVTALGYKVDEQTLQRVEVAYGVQSREELFYGIGIGSLRLDKLEELLNRSSGSRLSWLRKVLRLEQPQEEKAADTPSYIIGSEEPGAPKFTIASCCNPIPGDPVIGIKGSDGTVTIHKKSCPVAESIAATHGDWVVVPKWLEAADASSFLVRLSLRGIDRVGMLNEISHYLSQVMGVNIRKLTLTAESGVFEGYIDLYVSSRVILEKMIRRLSSINGITQVTRTEI